MRAVYYRIISRQQSNLTIYLVSVVIRYGVTCKVLKIDIDSEAVRKKLDSHLLDLSPPHSRLYRNVKNAEVIEIMMHITQLVMKNASALMPIR